MMHASSQASLPKNKSLRTSGPLDDVRKLLVEHGVDVSRLARVLNFIDHPEQAQALAA